METTSSPERQYPPTGIYEHYKSTPEARRYYQVLGFARHTETEEILAVYIPLYVIPEHTGLRLQVRPLDMFIETIEHNGDMVPRFKYVGAEL
jgi:cyclomaltodextrinase / maltogenic alpha-amylase / neopullulanase